MKMKPAKQDPPLNSKQQETDKLFPEFHSPPLRKPIVWALLCFVTLLQGCSDKDSQLEQAFTEQLIQHKTDNVLSIDLQTVFGSGWDKACLQSPYMLQSIFEKNAGKKITGYTIPMDNRFAIWVFYMDGHTSRVEIERIKVMDNLDKGTSCTSFQHPFLYFEVDSGEKKYFFNDERGIE